MSGSRHGHIFTGYKAYRPTVYGKRKSDASRSFVVQCHIPVDPRHGYSTDVCSA